MKFMQEEALGDERSGLFFALYIFTCSVKEHTYLYLAEIEGLGELANIGNAIRNKSPQIRRIGTN